MTRDGVGNLAGLLVLRGALPSAADMDDRTPEIRLQRVRPFAAGMLGALEELVEVAKGFRLVDADRDVRELPGRPVWAAALAQTMERLESAEMVIATFDGGGGDRGLRCPLSEASGPESLARPSWAERLDGAAEEAGDAGDDEGAAAIRSEAARWRAFGLRPECALLARVRDLVSDFHRGALRAGWPSAAEALIRRGLEVFAPRAAMIDQTTWVVSELARFRGTAHAPGLARTLRQNGARVWRGPDGRNVVDADDAARALGLSAREAKHVDRELARGVREVCAPQRSGRVKATEKQGQTGGRWCAQRRA